MCLYERKLSIPHFFHELSIHSLKCAKAQLGPKSFLLLSFHHTLVGSLL